MDPRNPVVQLCVQGMEQETRGDMVRAAELFNQAWTRSTTDFERCIAAHYVARHQLDPRLALHWNQLAFDLAHSIADQSVAGFLPSLSLNLGKSHEDLGNAEEAQRLYQSAKDAIGSLPPGGYRDVVQSGIDRGLVRVSGSGKNDPARS